MSKNKPFMKSFTSTTVIEIIVDKERELTRHDEKEILDYIKSKVLDTDDQPKLLKESKIEIRISNRI